MLKKSVVIGIILLFAGNCFAASAGNTSSPKTPYGSGFAKMETSGFGPFKASVDSTFIDSRDLNGENNTKEAELRGAYHLLRIGYTVMDRFEPYVTIGASTLKTKWRQDSNAFVKAKAENDIALGAGAKVLLYEIPEYRLRLSADGHFLYSDPGIDKVKINSSADRTVSAAEFRILEAQLAGILSIEFPLRYGKDNSTAVYSLIPYLGFGYQNTSVDTTFTYSGTQYELGTAENDKTYVLITGCELTSKDNFSLNAEGRFLAETAVSGGFTAKF